MVACWIKYDTPRPVFFGRNGLGIKVIIFAYLDAVKTVPDIKGVFLTTDFKENANVRLFYKSMGFKVKGDFVQGGKRKMSAYFLKFN